MNRQYVTANDIEPGRIFQGKTVEGWHVSDTSFSFYAFGQRCDYVVVEMTDGTRIHCTLLQEGI
jgi:hypothetical protein